MKQSVSDFCLANPGVNSCPTADFQRGNILIQTPKHSGSLWTTYVLPFGLQLGYGLTYQGRRLREPLAIFWDKRRPLPRYASAFCEMLADYVREIFPVTGPSAPNARSRVRASRPAPRGQVTPPIDKRRHNGRIVR